jgi:hypothetical protein
MIANSKLWNAHCAQNSKNHQNTSMIFDVLVHLPDSGSNPKQFLACSLQEDD